MPGDPQQQNANASSFFPSAAPAATAPAAAAQGAPSAAPAPVKADASSYFPTGGGRGGAGQGSGVTPHGPSDDGLEGGVFDRSMRAVGNHVSAAALAPYHAVKALAQPADTSDPVEAGIAASGHSDVVLPVYRIGKYLLDSTKAGFTGYRDVINQALTGIAQGKTREAVAGLTGAAAGGPGSTGAEMGGRARELAAGTRPGGDLATPLAGDATDALMMWLTDKAADAVEGAGNFKTATARGMAQGEKPSAMASATEGAINRGVGASSRDVTYGSPAQFLVDNQIPFVSRGPQLQAVTEKLNELTGQLRTALGASTKPVNAYDIVDGIIKDASRKLDASIADPAEIEAAKGELDLMMQGVLKRNAQYPGTLTASEANELKQAIGDRVNFRARSEIKMPDLVDKAYRKAYGALRDGVNQAAPRAAELNQNVSNGIALKNSLMEAVNRERAGQGGTNVSGAMTMRGAATAAAGRVLPRIIQTAQELTPAARAAAAGGKTAVVAGNGRGGRGQVDQFAAARAAASGNQE